MKKQRIFFLFYALAFGWVGGHRYYLGHTLAGVFYTLFFWTFIPGVIALVELVIYSLKSDEEFDAAYNRK